MLKYKLDSVKRSIIELCIKDYIELIENWYKIQQSPDSNLHNYSSSKELLMHKPCNFDDEN